MPAISAFSSGALTLLQTFNRPHASASQADASISLVKIANGIGDDPDATVFQSPQQAAAATVNAAIIQNADTGTQDADPWTSRIASAESNLDEARNFLDSLKGNTSISADQRERQITHWQDLISNTESIVAFLKSDTGRLLANHALPHTDINDSTSAEAKQFLHTVKNLFDRLGKTPPGAPQSYQEF